MTKYCQTLCILLILILHYLENNHVKFKLCQLLRNSPKCYLSQYLQISQNCKSVKVLHFITLNSFFIETAKSNSTSDEVNSGGYVQYLKWVIFFVEEGTLVFLSFVRQMDAASRPSSNCILISIGFDLVLSVTFYFDSIDTRPHSTQQNESRWCRRFLAPSRRLIYLNKGFKFSFTDFFVKNCISEKFKKRKNEFYSIN